MSSAGSQERLKEEAKTVRLQIDSIVKESGTEAAIVKTVAIFAGMITETLLEYEEPDVVMEQTFHRIAGLLDTDPDDGSAESQMPLAFTVDHDTELGRVLARKSADRLPRGLDDAHEIAIAMILSDFPVWEEQGQPRDRLLRLLVEMVITSLTFEMATQDFCDLLIDDFIAEGHTAQEALMCLGAIAGSYLADARLEEEQLPDDASTQLMNVMVRESLQHGTPGSKDWASLAPSNDTPHGDIGALMSEIKPEIEEFFVLIGLDDALGRAVSVAKAVGRMVAVISLEEVGQIHPTIAKSLAKTGMILGLNREQPNT